MTNSPAEPDLEVSVEEAAELQRAGAQLVDVREDHEHEAGHVPGVTHIPLGALGAAGEQIEAGRTIVFICKSGGRSLMAAQAFHQAGYDARSLAGGTEAWQASGRPLEPEGGHVASH